MNDKPFSQACENNKRPILQELKQHFASVQRVLEIGSGTGQHCVFFAENLPYLFWQASDQVHYHPGVNAWIDDMPQDNIGRPVELVFPTDSLPAGDFDGVFSANTAHIMQKDAVQSLMQQVSAHLPAGGVFCQYGPFTENGEFNSESNRDFHHYLVEEGYGGYRDIEELQQWAPRLLLSEKIPMPANNLLLVWQVR